MCFLNQELLKPVAHTCWSEESCSQSSKFDDDEIVEGTSATQWGTHHSDAEVSYIHLQPLMCGEESTPVRHSTSYASFSFPSLPFFSFPIIKDRCL